MSTLPSDAANTADPAPVLMAARSDRHFEKLVREFSVAADEVGASRPSEEELRDLCRQVADLTSELFRGEMTIEVKRDLEIPDDIYFVVDVAVTGNVDEVMARIKQWHLAMRRLAGGRADLFCLSFDMR